MLLAGKLQTPSRGIELRNYDAPARHGIEARLEEEEEEEEKNVSIQLSRVHFAISERMLTYFPAQKPLVNISSFNIPPRNGER